jgi:hypothetical protein
MIEELPHRLEKALKQTLVPAERVLVKLKGAFDEGLICTDRRVIILKAGIMTGVIFGVDTFQVPYRSVAGAEVNFHLLTGYFELSTAGTQSMPKSFWQAGSKPTAARAVNCVSISGPDRATRFRQACSLIVSMASRY